MALVNQLGTSEAWIALVMSASTLVNCTPASEAAEPMAGAIWLKTLWGT
jgi:hypothetical protein